MKKMFAIIAMLVLLAACGGTKKSAPPAVDCSPEWYMVPPSDDTHLYSARRAQSPDVQMAFDIAAQEARQDISTQIANETQVLIDQFKEQVGAANDPVINSLFQSTNRTVAAEALLGAKVTERVQCKEGNVYNGYVLMAMPTGLLKQKLLESMKKEQELYTRFQAEKAFKTLEDEVEKYKQANGKSL